MNFMYRKNISDINIYILLLIYVITTLFACSKMSPLYVTNEWADPNVYFNVAKGMVNGKVLYTEIFDHKGPFIFFIYAIGYLISNNTFLGMFFIEIISWFFLAISLYKISKIYFSRNSSSILTMLFFIPFVKIIKAGGSAEEFILCLEGVSLYLFLQYFNKNNSIHKPKYMFIHGMLFTAVLLTKINLIIFWVFPLLFIFINILFHKEFKNLINNILLFLIGSLIIALPIIGYLYCNNALEEAYNIYIKLNSAYAKIGSLKKTTILLTLRILYLFIEPLSLFIFATIGIFIFPLKHIKNPLGKYSILLTGISLYIIIFMGKFQYYYPIPYLIFSFLGLLQIANYLKEKNTNTNVYLSIKDMYLITLIIVFANISVSKMSNTRVEEWFFPKDVHTSKTVMTDKLRVEIMKEKNPTLLNLGFGLANNLFTTCNIVPNVKYFITPNLSYSFYPRLRQEQFKYIKNKKTDFIIIQEYITGSDYYKKQNPVDRPSYLKELPILNENYKLILADTLTNYIDENSDEIYYLYKKNP